MSEENSNCSWKDKKSRALRGIRKKDVFLHRHAFKGDYMYDELEERLGRIKILISKRENYRWRHYSHTGMISYKGRKLRIFLNPKETYMPECFIEISNPSQAYLVKLKKAVPDLNIHFLEYTLDLYCSSAVAVRRLFDVLPKYYYVPHARKVSFPGKPGRRNMHTSELNRTFKISKLKIYERGEDKTPWGEGWYRTELDRVRVEYKATEGLLSYHGMNSLNDLIVNCNFESIFLKRFQFKIFRNSGQLPKENDRYAKVDKLECFQKQYIEAKKRGIKNLNQRIKDAPGFDSLKKSVKRKVKKFDRNWRIKLNT